MVRKRKPTVLEKLARSGPKGQPPTAKEISRSLRTLRDAARELPDKPFKVWACLVDAEPKLLDGGVKAMAKAFGYNYRTLWRALIRLRDAGYVDLEVGKHEFLKTAVRLRIGQIAEANNRVYKVGASVLPDQSPAPVTGDPPLLRVVPSSKPLNKRQCDKTVALENPVVDESSYNIRPPGGANPLENADESGPSWDKSDALRGVEQKNRTRLCNRENDPSFSEGIEGKGSGLEPSATDLSHLDRQSVSSKDPYAAKPPELPPTARSPETGARVPKLPAKIARRRADSGGGLTKLPAPAKRSRVDVGKLKKKASAASRVLEKRTRSGSVAPLPPGWKAGSGDAPSVLYGFTVKGDDRETLLGHLARGNSSKDRIATVTALGTLARKQYQEWCHKRPDFRGVDVEHDPKHDKTWEKFAVGCFKGGLRPVQVFDYWADPEHNFTRMNNPAYSRSFVCSLKNLDTVWQDLKTERPASVRGRPQKVDALHAYDEKKIHPELRRTLEDAGHDVSEKTDRALMTVQVLAKRFAAGAMHVGAAPTLRERAISAMHLFKKKGE